MFDRIPSLKDFIIYVIPGIIICYFSVDIYCLLKNSTFTTDKIVGNPSLSFIGILFSFLIGFLISQFQIILFGRLFRIEFKKMCSILGCFENDTQLKNILIDKIKSAFGLTSVDEKDSLIVFLCLSYVRSKSDENNLALVDRHNNMSSFAMATMLPLTLAVLDILFRFQIGIVWTTLILLFFVVLLYWSVIRIVFNFRSDYYKNIFRLFLVLSI